EFAPNGGEAGRHDPLPASTPLPGSLERISGAIPGAQTPRLGILEPAGKKPRPGVASPMPRVSDAAVLTGDVALPPQKRSPMGFIARGALLRFLAGGAVLAYFCFANDPPDSPDVAAPGARDDGLADKSEETGTPAVASAGAEKPSDSVKPAPPPRRATPKEKSRPGSSKDALPAGSLFTSKKIAVPSHPEQKRINAATDKGVAFVRSEQTASGSWIAGNRGHSVGYAALPGLTLLECGVK